MQAAVLIAKVREAVELLAREPERQFAYISDRWSPPFHLWDLTYDFGNMHAVRWRLEKTFPADRVARARLAAIDRILKRQRRNHDRWEDPAVRDDASSVEAILREDSTWRDLREAVRTTLEALDQLPGTTELAPVDVLFPDIHWSEADFAACREYWNQMRIDVAAGLGCGSLWECSNPWGDERFPPEMREVYQASSLALRRGFQIQQFPPEDFEDHIGVILKNVPMEDDTPPEETYLMLPLVLTEKTAAVAERILTIFMDPQVPVDQMGLVLGAAGIRVNDETAPGRIREIRRLLGELIEVGGAGGPPSIGELPWAVRNEHVSARNLVQQDELPAEVAERLADLERLVDALEKHREKWDEAALREDAAWQEVRVAARAALQALDREGA